MDSAPAMKVSPHYLVPTEGLLIIENCEKIESIKNYPTTISCRIQLNMDALLNKYQIAAANHIDGDHGIKHDSKVKNSGAQFYPSTATYQSTKGQHSCLNCS